MFDEVATNLTPYSTYRVYISPNLIGLVRTRNILVGPVYIDIELQGHNLKITLRG
jgi:hypothetical protein